MNHLPNEIAHRFEYAVCIPETGINKRYPPSGMGTKIREAGKGATFHCGA